MTIDNKVLIVSEGVVSDRIINGLDLNGYASEVCGFDSIVESIQSFRPDIVLVLNLEEKEKDAIIVVKQNSTVPVVTSSEIKTSIGSIIKFSGIDLVSTSCQAEALIVNKVKIYLRLKKIEEMARHLLEI